MVTLESLYSLFTGIDLFCDLVELKKDYLKDVDTKSFEKRL